MNKIIEVTTCNSCPFWGNTMDGMECNHPYWDDKGPYANMIITSPNYITGIPDKCPLKNEEVSITYKST